MYQLPSWTEGWVTVFSIFTVFNNSNHSTNFVNGVSQQNKGHVIMCTCSMDLQEPDVSYVTMVSMVTRLAGMARCGHV